VGEPECGICSTKAIIWFLARVRWLSIQKKKPTQLLRRSARVATVTAQAETHKGVLAPEKIC
jgi:hypothetical protein